MESATPTAVPFLLAHFAFHGSNPLSGPVADLLFLAGPVLLLVTAWLLVRRPRR